jgi:8-oxo-dGTP pyrophosphatase MutT (NUDIX family)
MAEARSVPRRISAGVILVDPEGRVLLQLRDDDPAIMFPGHWGITGGAGAPDETAEETARREVEEETGVRLDRFEPFRAYYFSERAGPSTRARADYELYLYHAPCVTPAEELVCGEGRALRYFGPEEIAALDVAYNHRDVLADFFASAIYARYLRGAPFGDDADRIEPLAHFVGALDTGAPWFETLMQSVALWEQPEEQVGMRHYRYLIGGEAFDWLLLAERLLGEAAGRVPPVEAERLLFEARPPESEGATLDDARLRDLIGDAKHRAHLNYVYGVIVEEALQYAAELEIAKERSNVSIGDHREEGAPTDPIYERIYGRPRAELLAEFRAEQNRKRTSTISLTELREFFYWLFKYRVKNSEPARVASDTRKALAQLSAINDAVRRSGRRASAPVEAAM